MTLIELPLMDRLRSAAYCDNPTIQEAADRLEQAEKLIAELVACLTYVAGDDIAGSSAYLIDGALASAKLFKEGT